MWFDAAHPDRSALIAKLELLYAQGPQGAPAARYEIDTYVATKRHLGDTKLRTVLRRVDAMDANFASFVKQCIPGTRGTVHVPTPPPQWGQAPVCTDLMRAAKYGDLQRLSGLLQRGADVHATFRSRQALDYALSSYEGQGPHLEVALELIRWGAPIEHRDQLWGSTPLMFAAQFGDRRAVEALLEMGANPCQTRSDGMRAYDFAVATHRNTGPHGGVAELLWQAEKGGKRRRQVKAHAPESALAD